MMFKRFKMTKTTTFLLALLVSLALLAGCSQPAATPPAPPPAPAPASTPDPAPAPAPSPSASLLEWDAWKAKMTGTINKDYYVIDLRTPDEIKMEKALEGAINIDANETLSKGELGIIDEKLATVPKDAVLLVHCKSGGRVKANIAKFTEKGFTNVFGLDAWTAFDNKGYMAATKITANTEQLKPEAWQAKMQGEIGKDYYVVDVRDKSEYDAGHIKGALNFGVRDQLIVDHGATMDAFAKAIPDKNALVLVHCAVGKRAKVAQAHLKAEGYTQVIILDNNISIDKDGNVKFE